MRWPWLRLPRNRRSRHARRERPRRARLLLLLACAALGADLGLERLVLDDDRLLGRAIAPFDPPILHARQARALEVLRTHLETGAPAAEQLMFDADLGWCPQPHSRVGEFDYDWAGARVGLRPLLRAGAGAQRRLLALGCSFTLGEEVAGSESWPAQLDALLPQTEVANLAVEGYGLDQALLRYRRDGRPLEAEEVWIGLLPSAVLRTTTLYPPALQHHSSLALFKPRFVLDAHERLRLVPNPAPSLERCLELLSDQSAFLEAMLPHDSWVARMPEAWAERGSRLGHHSALIRLWHTLLEARQRVPHAALRDPDHEAHRLARALLLELEREVELDGARLRVLILPDESDLAHARKRTQPCWAPLVEGLREAGLEVVELAPHFPAPGSADWRAHWAPRGHYSALGHRRVARALSELWTRKGSPARPAPQRVRARAPR